MSVRFYLFLFVMLFTEISFVALKCCNTIEGHSPIFENISGRITPEESLFVYPNGTSHSTFNDLSFEGATLQELLATASNESLVQAVIACMNVS